jgi:cellulose synthase/poly-beta-1,6-N-acetylglucosamine synthase-like glycosyltransferase
MLIVEVLYALCIVLPSLYGLNALVLIWLYLRHRHDPHPTAPWPTEWPRVTVQLPIYNELHTVERLLTTAAGLDYPRDRLEIQLLDDSTDGTRQVAARKIARLRQQGIDAVHITRPERAGFKAGALAHGLTMAKGALIAIFDADFLPPPSFLRSVVPHFADPTVGCVQTRWTHLNRGYSPLTRAQALGVDGHFVVDQTARARAGLFINFNGSAGVWRRTCVEDVGGWQDDTLTEDLDLSYRAQLRGWRIVYLPDVATPAELPPQIGAFKRQQARWAQGSIQTALKTLGPLLRCDQPWRVKLEGIVHLTGYVVHPLMLLAVLLTLPLSFSHSWVLAAAPWLTITALGPPLLYAIAQAADGGAWGLRLRALPLLVLLGMGLSLSNTQAVLKALLGVDQGFERTPKFALHQPRDTWFGSTYALSGGGLVWAEMGLAVLALALLAAPGIPRGLVPWLLLHAGSFGYVAGVSLCQAHRRWRWLATHTGSAADRAARIRSGGPTRTPAGCPDPDR